MTVPRLRSLFLSVNQHIMKTFCPKNHLLGVSIQECGSYYTKVIPSLFSLWCSSDVAKMHSSAVEECLFNLLRSNFKALDHARTLLSFKRSLCSVLFFNSKFFT